MGFNENTSDESAGESTRASEENPGDWNSGTQPTPWARLKGAKGKNYKEYVENFVKRSDDEINIQLEVQPSLEMASDPSILDRLLSHEGFDANIRNQDGKTVLFFVKPLKVDTLGRLILKGAVVDQKDKNGRTPLSVAAELGDISKLEILVEHGKADINSEDDNQQTPLHWAARKKNPVALEHLLQGDSTGVNHQDAHGQTPLLASCDAWTSPSGPYWGGWGTGTKFETIIELLLGAKADPNLTDHQENSSLTLAIDRQDYKIVELLLDASETDVNRQDTRGRTPFSLAAEKKQHNIMKLLMSYNADPHKEDKEGHTGFWWFLKARHGDALPPAKGAGREDISSLVESLEHPDSQGRSGRSFLSWAAEYGDGYIVDCLLQRKEVNPSMRDKAERAFSRTPLHWALENKHRSVVQAILKSGKYDFPLHELINDSDSKDLELETALEWINVLLEFDPSSYMSSLVVMQDEKGRTPLHLACRLANEKIVGVLAEATAMPSWNQQDNIGRTPLQYALGRKNKVIVDLLLKSLSQLKPVQSKDWFKLRNEAHWIQLSTRGKYGFDWALIDKLKFDWRPGKGKRTLCLSDKDDGDWPELPRRFGAHDDMKKDLEKSKYIQYISKTHEHQHLLVTYISVALPFEKYTWGIAWVRESKRSCQVNMFISTLSNGWIPKSAADIFLQFLEHLRSGWDSTCSVTSERIDDLRREQGTQKGQSSSLINKLTNDVSIRADVRECLRSQVNRLIFEINNDPFFKKDEKRQLVNAVQEIDRLVTGRLDRFDQAARELLQIELAWVAMNEAGSLKRLSWITFIFLPLMFASSLFGMNVDLLESNPDWRWYILFGALSCLLTGVLWIASKYFPNLPDQNRFWRGLPPREKAPCPNSCA